MFDARDRDAEQLSLWAPETGTDEWILRESPRARRLSVKVFHSGRVEVVVPRRTSRKTVEQFLNQHREWIATRRRQAASRAVPPAPFPPPNIEFAINDTGWRIHLTAGAGRLRIRENSPGLLSITGFAPDPRALRFALRRWLLVKGAQILTPLMEQTTRELGFSYKRTGIRRQRTRWGSCSNRGTISLNCCLMFQRPEVVRYLFIHELAHTLHMNHSRKFWACVAQHCPDYRRLDRELAQGWRRVPAWVFDSK